MVVTEMHLKVPFHVIEVWAKLQSGHSLQAKGKGYNDSIQWMIDIQRNKDVADIVLKDASPQQGLTVEWQVDDVVFSEQPQPANAIPTDGTQGINAVVKREISSDSLDVTSQFDTSSQETAKLEDVDQSYNDTGQDSFDHDDDDDDDDDYVKDKSNEVDEKAVQAVTESMNCYKRTIFKRQNVGTMPLSVMKSTEKAESQYKCSGCDQVPTNPLKHVKSKHKHEPEVLKHFDEYSGARDMRGVDMTCPLCGVIRRGFGILRHLGLIHEGVENYTELYEQIMKEHTEKYKEHKKHLRNLKERELRAKEKFAKKRGRKKMQLFNCPKCSKTFRREDLVRLHISKAHQGKAAELLKMVNVKDCDEYDSETVDVICSVCGTSRKGKGILRHFRKTHKNVSDYDEKYKAMRLLCNKLIYGEKTYEEPQLVQNSPVHETAAEEQEPKQVGKSVPLSKVSFEDLNNSVCLFCHKNFDTSLTEHLSSCHNLSSEEYGQLVSDYQVLISGKELPSDIQDKYTKVLCALCAHKFAEHQSQNTLARHIKYHNITRVDYMQLIRKSCSYRNRYFTDLRLRKTWPCQSCGQKYTLMNNLKAHMRRAHANDKEAWIKFEELRAQKSQSTCMVTKCVFCQQERKGSSIFKHLQVAHIHEPSYDTAVKETRALMDGIMKATRNKKQREREVGSIGCRHCPKKFNNRASRLRHEAICEDNPVKIKRLKCKKCSYWTQVPERLTAHIDKCHSETSAEAKLFICHLCGKSYTRQSSLHVHMGSKHNLAGHGQPAKVYKCPVCDKEFRYRSTGFKEHLATHSEERNFICPTCGKTFKTQDNLRNHIKFYHENRYPYRCDKCGHGVQHKRYLTSHVCGRVRRRQGGEKLVVDTSVVVNRRAEKNVVIGKPRKEAAAIPVIYQDMEANPSLVAPQNERQLYEMNSAVMPMDYTTNSTSQSPIPMTSTTTMPSSVIPNHTVSVPHVTSGGYAMMSEAATAAYFVSAAATQSPWAHTQS